MLTKNDIIEKAFELGFVDAGFTTADPFEKHRELLVESAEEYAWAEKVGLALLDGSDPRKVHPEAKSIIVLVESYFRGAFPPAIERNFGRCYLDDDRVTKDGLALRIKAFRSFLRENGIDSKVPFNLPHRAAAVRAGLGGTGKNCLFYSRTAARKSSWVLPFTVTVDREFAPDTPSAGPDCPDWCRNACISACPTRALKGNCRVDPRKCISFLSYFGRGITPLELREPMGMYVYGCDRCQEVCPRNAPWLAQELPVNAKVAAKAEYFDLPKLLHMDKDYFTAHIWPHMFYMSPDDIWRWKMNVARVMGNSTDDKYTGDLARAFRENDDPRMKGMAAWALGKIGGQEAKSLLEGFAEKEGDDMVRGEIDRARSMFG
jgi:epoxyqueuosine reductase